MNIRHAEITDFDFIYKTWKQNQKYGMSIPRKIRITERITKKEMFIIEDKVSVGMFNLHIRSLPKEMKGYVELTCFAVDDNYKNKGYGTKALDWIKENYKTIIICDSHKGSDNNRFYERNGFISYGEKIVGNTPCILYKLNNTVDLFEE